MGSQVSQKNYVHHLLEEEMRPEIGLKFELHFENNLAHMLVFSFRSAKLLVYSDIYF